tara:strand:+ start:419 stop:613 length:195 start_codon:yes stop_codon:yes gene_type:complete
MKTLFSVGDVLKNTESNLVFKCAGFSSGSRLVPDNWPICEEGAYHNPAFLRKYNGAISALNIRG